MSLGHIGVPVPERSDDEPLEQLVDLSQQGESKTIRPKLLAEVQKRREDVRKIGVQMTDTRKQLKDSQQSKASIDENVNKILCSISKLRDNVQAIAHERNITREKLESKQRECQLLSEMLDMLARSMQDSKKQHHRFWKKDRQLQEKEVANKMLLEEKIAKKKKKIEMLEEKLQQKDSELQSAQQVARSLDEKLFQARVELDKKHEEVKQLQKENEELACFYNIEKEQVSKLVQIAVTLTADKEKVEVHAPASIFCLYMSNRFVSIIIMHVYLFVATTDQYKR